MKTEQKTVYSCDFCGKRYFRKHACENHEIRCFKNPANDRPCFDCEHLTKEGATIYTGRDTYYGAEPINKTVEFLYCNKLEKFLYTPVNELKGNYSHLDEDGNDFENNPMPIKCEHLKNQYIYDTRRNQTT